MHQYFQSLLDSGDSFTLTVATMQDVFQDRGLIKVLPDALIIEAHDDNQSELIVVPFAATTLITVKWG